ncbi:MAG: glycerophosphodiester phosphodiesterase family protein [Pirellulales bacterium]
MTPSDSTVGTIIRDFVSCWKALALTDIAYKLFAFIVLTPLVGSLFRTVLALSGKTVVADQDILFFFLGPVGWVCFITVGAVWLGIVALEQAALMGIVCASGQQQRMGTVAALRFASAHAWRVLRVTARLVALTLLVLIPFLVVGGLVFLALLTEYDINYYLKEKPPAFWLAFGIGGLLVTGLVVLLLRLFTGWFFALPLVLFEDVAPPSALRVSRERVTGHRTAIVAWIVGWLLATTLLSTVTTALVVGLGRFVVPKTTGSLTLLAAAIGVTMLLWAGVGLAVNLVSATSFATMLFNLYRQLGSHAAFDPSRLNLADKKKRGAGFELSRGRLIAAGLVGAVVAVSVGIGAIHSVRLEDNVEIIAHRGSSATAPENTMAAVTQAIDDRADWVEIDVQETVDGEVVVFHDSDFKKLANVDLKIWDATTGDLAELDIGSWFAPEFKDQRVPTLTAVLQECKGKIGVNIELKYYGHDQRLEQRVVDIVEAQAMESEVMLMTLKLDAVKKMKSLRPDWKVGLLMSVSVGDLKKSEADFLAVNAGFANRRFVESAHGDGREVYVWTVNDAATMSAMIGRGVDGLITDKPALARTVLEQRAAMSAPERLLLDLAGVLGVTPEIGEQ